MASSRAQRSTAFGSSSVTTSPDNILVNGNRVPITWDVQGRPWFVCPGCGRHRQHLYLDELLCRRCAGLDYISRHLHRSTPGVHQVVRLRRKIGADPRPFAPLPERPEHHARKPKLSEYQRKEALKRRATGETLASIAKSYAVDISMISRLR